MAGTSVDAVDAALVDITRSGATLQVAPRRFIEYPFDASLRDRVHAVFDPSGGRTDEICELNFALGELFADAAAAVCEGETPDLICSHGQTIWHNIRSDGRASSTFQIGEPSVIAERTGATVVADFRPRDIAAGGQGAPLSSYVDVLLFGDQTRSRAIQNIGGIANVTWIPRGFRREDAFAFDTGPGNVLIDRATWVATDGQARYDRDGAMAARGAPDRDLVAELLAGAYFRREPPKSTGRELFGASYADAIAQRVRDRGGDDADIVATLTLLTVESIADAYGRFLPAAPDDVVLGGGGARNRTVREWLARRLPTAHILDHDDFGLPTEGREAIYFAILGYETIHGRASTLPRCTGSRRSSVLGKILPGRNYHSLVARLEGAMAIDRVVIAT